nr:MAG TPA_asm: hypothetical protein [Caudoviricetes sp.]
MSDPATHLYRLKMSSHPDDVLRRVGTQPLKLKYGYTGLTYVPI